MPAAKAPKKASPRKKGEAARAEKKDQPETVDFRGLELKVPTKLPGTILFDLADIDAGRDLRGTMEFLRSLIGEDQYQALREKIATEQIEFEDTIGVLVELLDSILEKSGLSMGE